MVRGRVRRERVVRRWVGYIIVVGMKIGMWIFKSGDL